MADEAQVIYEYSAAATVEFKTNDLKVRINRPKMRVDTRVDGVKVVTDPGFKQRVFSFTAIIPTADMNELHDVQIAAIDYTGLYPRIQKIYWGGATFESNIEVAITELTATDMGAGWWNVAITMVEKDQ